MFYAIPQEGQPPELVNLLQMERIAVDRQHRVVAVPASRVREYVLFAPDDPQKAAAELERIQQALPAIPQSKPRSKRS